MGLILLFDSIRFREIAHIVNRNTFLKRDLTNCNMDKNILQEPCTIFYKFRLTTFLVSDIVKTDKKNCQKGKWGKENATDKPSEGI